MRVDQIKVDTYQVMLTLDEVKDLAFLADRWVKSPQSALLSLIKKTIETEYTFIKGRR